MRLETFNNRAKKAGLQKNSKAYKILLEMLTEKGKRSKVYPNESGFKKVILYTHEVYAASQRMGIKMIWEFDYSVAPRGGVVGWYVQLPNNNQKIK